MRKLASIKTVSDLIPIEGRAADKEWDMDDCEMVRYKPKEGTMAKEYIEREEALSAIKQAFEKGEGPSLYIKRIPAADVVPVVRCEDCRLRGRKECAMFYRCECGEQHTWETDNDFCSYGEQ